MPLYVTSVVDTEFDPLNPYDAELIAKDFRSELELIDAYPEKGRINKDLIVAIQDVAEALERFTSLMTKQIAQNTLDKG